MKQKPTLRRVLASAVAALAAAAAVWLLCRWVGYDLQLRIGNEPVYEIANDDYTQIIDVPEDGLWQAVPLEAGQTLYGCSLRFSTHGELYRAGMVMVALCDADGTVLSTDVAGGFVGATLGPQARLAPARCGACPTPPGQAASGGSPGSWASNPPLSPTSTAPLPPRASTGPPQHKW